jgi:3-methyladenine DNA glycosylase AlkC
MSYLLKDIYSPDFYNKFGVIAEHEIPGFNKKEFLSLIFDDSWQQKELKQRMKHTSLVLNSFLPMDYAESTDIICNIIKRLQKEKITESSLEFMFFPDYIESYGINHFETSVKAIEFVTQFTSCEFAVRPFILKYEKDMIAQMIHWSAHQNFHVRRLASEGSRPRLPWAIALPQFKKNPIAILPILENLKNDSSEYVRRSVANGLNDISKDNPEMVLEIAGKWKGKTETTDALLKHGCRTLLKQGENRVMDLFGFSENESVVLSDFQLVTPVVKIGDPVIFSFGVANNGKHTSSVRLEYAIYYLRQNGSLSKKVFKISERNLNPKEKIEIVRKQSFRVITTRKFYPGRHKLSIIINGRERNFAEFELV